MRLVGWFLLGLRFPRLVLAGLLGLLLLGGLFADRARREKGIPSWESKHGYFGGYDAGR